MLCQAGATVLACTMLVAAQCGLSAGADRGRRRYIDTLP